MFEATYGLFKIGAILVPLNPTFNSPQVISALNHLQASHLIIGAETRLPKRGPRENLSLLKQISPRFKEATHELLKEKWEGNIANDATARAKRARGEWSGVLPGKTKKWKDFYGLRFEWVLAECVGSGLVELFETGSVGWGVRAI